MEVRFAHTGESGEYFEKVLRVFRDAARANPRLKLTEEEKPAGYDMPAYETAVNEVRACEPAAQIFDGGNDADPDDSGAFE